MATFAVITFVYTNCVIYTALLFRSCCCSVLVFWLCYYCKQHYIFKKQYSPHLNLDCIFPCRFSGHFWQAHFLGTLFEGPFLRDLRFRGPFLRDLRFRGPFLRDLCFRDLCWRVLHFFPIRGKAWTHISIHAL